MLAVLPAGIAQAAAAPEHAGAKPGAVGFLADALVQAADAVADQRRPAEGLMLCRDASGSLLTDYVAEILAVHWQARGLKVERFSARLPVGIEAAAPLPDPVLKALRDAPSTTFVRAVTVLESAQWLLAVDVYDVGTGATLQSLRVPVRLSQDQAELITRERRSMSAADGDWLALLQAAFARASSPPPAADEAEARFFLESGLWDLATSRFQALTPAGPNTCFMHAIFALQLSGHPDEALQLAEAARRDRPESGPLCALLAWLNLRSGREDYAVLLLEQARLSDMTREGLYRYAEGLMALEAGNDEKAEAKLARAAALLPEAAFVQIQLARFYLNRARLAEAIDCYRRGLEAGPQTAESWAELALALRAAGDQDEALAALRQAFAVCNSNAAVNRQLASHLRGSGRHEEALAVLRKAAEAHPHDLTMLAAYGDAALQMWRVEEARQAFANGVALTDDASYPTVRLAEVLVIQQQYRPAREMLEDLLARRPEYHPARVALGRLLGQLGQLDQAVSVLEEATVAPEYEADARLALAEVHARAGNTADAVACAQIAASSRPSAETYAALSAAFLANDETAKAENAARTAVTQDPRTDVGRVALARALEERDRLEEATREIEQALEVNPFSVEALVTAGRLAQAGGDAPKCAELWRRALALNQWNAELHLDLGVLLGQELGDWEAALKHLTLGAELKKMRTGAAPPSVGADGD